MLLRVLSGRVAAHSVGEFNSHIRERVLPQLRAQHGLVYLKFARKLEVGGGETFILVSEWRTPGDLHAWAGADLREPVLVRDRPELFEQCRVELYEALDLLPEEADQAIGSRLPGAGDGAGAALG